MLSRSGPVVLRKLALTLVASGFLPSATPVSAQQASHFLKAAGTPVTPKVSIAWNRYYDSEALATLMRKIAKAYPQLARLQSLGKSYQGREIWCLTITDFKKGSPERKPATYVQGNIHGNELQGGEFSLYLAWYLTESFGDTKYVQDLLAEKVFYVVPTLNPDARDHFIHRPNRNGTSRMSLMSSGEGRHPNDDLNGDGHLTQMRWKDPYGTYRIDPMDPRRMVEIDDDAITHVNWVKRARHPDERNYRVMRESLDTLQLSEPGDDRHDLNRDWRYDWGADDGSAERTGRHPFAHPETRAARDFFLKHPNIAVAVSLHNAAGEIYRAMAKRTADDPDDAEGDVRLHDSLGAYGERVLPGYRYRRLSGAAPNTDIGREIDWMFGDRGAYAFIVELMTDYSYYHQSPWTNEARAYDLDGHTEEAYRFDRELLFGDAFVPWHEFRHPTLGAVEIGGFKKNFGRLNPGFLMEAEAHRTMAFILYLGDMAPRLEVQEVAVKDAGNGMQEVTAVIANARLVPTHSGQDLRRHITRPDCITLQAGGEVIAVRQISNIPGKSFVTVQWTVRGGDGKYSVTVNSVRGGVASASSVSAK